MIGRGFPGSLRRALERALGDPEAADEHLEALRQHHLETLPRARARQLESGAEPHRWLFHEPAPWAHMPSLGGALTRLSALLGDDATPWLPDESLGAWFARAYFGGCSPLFQAHDAELARVAQLAPAAAAAADRWAVVDERLGAAILHEIVHFAPDRRALDPPYFDEAVAGYLGTHLLPATAFPAPGRPVGLLGFPRFAQVGHALARAFGRRALAAAQSGRRPWDEVVGRPLRQALARLGWEGHRRRRSVDMHPDPERPERWIRLAYWTAAGGDPAGVELDDLDDLGDVVPPCPGDSDDVEAEMLRFALASGCLRATADWRAETVLPTGPLTLDLVAGVCRDAEDAARYTLPPRWRARELAAGRERIVVEVPDPSLEALDRLAADLMA